MLEESAARPVQFVGSAKVGKQPRRAVVVEIASAAPGNDLPYDRDDDEQRHGGENQYFVRTDGTQPSTKAIPFAAVILGGEQLKPVSSVGPPVGVATQPFTPFWNLLYGWPASRFVYWKLNWNG